MPSGKTHLKLSIATSVLINLSPTIMPYSNNLKLSVGLLAGSIFATFITPDLDVDNGNITNKILKNKSKLLEKIFRLITTPYRKLFKHRGRSHIFIFGTLGRILYFSIILFILFLIFNLITIKEFLFFSLSVGVEDVDDLIDDLKNATINRFVFGFLFSACVLDGVHILADKIVSKFKKKNRRVSVWKRM